jgi:hypothetical protein
VGAERTPTIWPPPVSTDRASATDVNISRSTSDATTFGSTVSSVFDYRDGSECRKSYDAEYIGVFTLGLGLA